MGRADAKPVLVSLARPLARRRHHHRQCRPANRLHARRHGAPIFSNRPALHHARDRHRSQSDVRQPPRGRRRSHHRRARRRNKDGRNRRSGPSDRARIAPPQRSKRRPYIRRLATRMATQPDLTWPSNYFNYYTEIEDHFRAVRGSGLFMLSCLDWALIETWKDAGVPLEAVLRGIDAAFEKWRSRKVKTQMVNSLAFCAQAVLTEAQTMSGAAQPRGRRDAAPPFELEALRAYLNGNASALP